MQSLRNASCRCAHADVIFSPPHLGLSIGHMGWKRLIQQEVTGCNEGQKRRDSRSMETNPFELTPEQKGLLVALAQETGKPIPALMAEALEGLQDQVHPHTDTPMTSGNGGQAEPPADHESPPGTKHLWE